MTAAQQLIQEGKELGLSQGLMKARQEDILDFLWQRFATNPKGLEDAIMGERDLKRLKVLLQVAATCPSMDAFAQAL